MRCYMNIRVRTKGSMMNVRYKKSIGFITAALAAMMVFSNASPAMADTSAGDQDTFNSAAEVSLQHKLSEIASTNNLDVEFSDFQIDAPQATISEYQGDADSYAASIVQAYEEDTASRIKQAPGISARGTANYTSSVFSGVPAGGACWVKQDFRATVTNYKVTSKSLRGSSYQTGVCLFQWSPNYSWFEGSLNVLSKGTFHAVIKGGPISFAATFKAFFHTNKSSLYQEAQ